MVLLLKGNETLYLIVYVVVIFYGVPKKNALVVSYCQGAETILLSMY